VVRFRYEENNEAKLPTGLVLVCASHVSVAAQEKNPYLDSRPNDEQVKTPVLSLSQDTPRLRRGLRGEYE
jgi:hypothetical protein